MIASGWAVPCSAGELSSGLSLYAQSGGAKLRNAVLGTAVGAEVRLTSDGHMVGGGAQKAFVYERFRFGVDVAAYALVGVSHSVAPLPEGLSAVVGDLVGARWAGFVGYEILDGPVYPYIDLRFSLTGAFTRLHLRSDELGDRGSTALHVLDGAVGPRAGVLVPITTWAAVDVSAYHPIIGGHERLTFNAGLSFWHNGRNDSHTWRMRRRQ